MRAACNTFSWLLSRLPGSLLLYLPALCNLMLFRYGFHSQNWYIKHYIAQQYFFSLQSAYFVKFHLVFMLFHKHILFISCKNYHAPSFQVFLIELKFFLKFNCLFISWTVHMKFIRGLALSYPVAAKLFC